MRHLLFLFFLFSCFPALAQYPPQAGVSGSTAIPANSSQFVSWATHCQITRGLMQIGNVAGGYATSGDSSLAIGPPDGYLVSLGDSGIAVLTFSAPIINGPGPDFAVFENGFANPSDPEEAFLELAFVEVSSDGIHFYRFPAASITPDTPQIPAAGVYMNARLLNDLAGKYIGGYGTPFDLDEMAGVFGLDVNHITHIRVVDVIGSIGAHASFDFAGRKINDPYPTPFPTSGFDLDAVGVIHQVNTGIHSPAALNAVSVYPNPATEKVVVVVPGTWSDVIISVTDVSGRLMSRRNASGKNTEIPLGDIPAGLYYLIVRNEKGNQWVGRISKS